jgi:hypothetical protein
MSRKELRETDRFEAMTEDGQQLTLIEYTTFIESITTGGRSWIAGLKEVRTLHGDHINVRGEGQYETLFGQKLTRI